MPALTIIFGDRTEYVIRHQETIDIVTRTHGAHKDARTILLNPRKLLGSFPNCYKIFANEYGFYKKLVDYGLGCYMNTTRDGTSTFLMVACQKSDPVVAKRALDEGNYVFALSSRGDTKRDAMTYAVCSKQPNTEVIGLLLKACPEILDNRISGRRPLQSALMANAHIDNIAMLKQKPSARELLEAIIHCGPDVVRMLVGWGAPLHGIVDCSLYSLSAALMYTGEHTHEIVRFLLDKGAKVDFSTESIQYEKTPMMWGLEKGASKRTLRLLLKNRVTFDSVDPEGNTELHYAAKYCPGFIKEMIEAGYGTILKYLNKKKQSVLHVAAQAEGSLKAYKAIRTIIEKDKSLCGVQDADLMTPLGYAISAGCKKSVKALSTVCPNAPLKRNDWSPLIYAIRKNFLDGFKCVLGNGGDINGSDKLLRTALHHAAWCCTKEAVELVLDSGADINAQDKKKWTAMHFAIRYKEDNIETLLKYTPNVTLAKTTGDRSILSMACRVKLELDTVLKICKAYSETCRVYGKSDVILVDDPYTAVITRAAGYPTSNKVAIIKQLHESGLPLSKHIFNTSRLP